VANVACDLQRFERKTLMSNLYQRLPLLALMGSGELGQITSSAIKRQMKARRQRDKTKK